MTADAPAGAARATVGTPDASGAPGTPAALRDWIAHRAAVTPARTALIAGGRMWSFAALDAEASHVATRLFASGVRAGDRVATLLHNGTMPAILVHAVLRLGATLVPLNTRLSPAEIAWQLGDAAPRLVVAERHTRALLPPDASSPDGPTVVDAATLPHSSAGATLPDAPLRAEHDPAHVLAVVYTSGTSGRPKGAMLTVSNFWWSAIGSALNLGVHADDRWLACLPLFHVGGLSIITRSAIYGTTAVVHESFDARAVNAAIDNDAVTIVSVVAIMLQRMLDERGDRPYPQTLRCVLLGGGPAPRLLLERCARLRVPVVQTYGLTETASQVATLPPEDALRKLGAAGKALYPNELRIAPSSRDPAAAGHGEIQVRGPVVTGGYLGAPDATSVTIRDGWLRTGDVGHLDDDGYLYVLDRRDDLIISGGENVYPAEVEAVLLTHSWAADAAVVGVPDPQWGQRVVALVQLTTDADAASAGAALRAHCRSVLASYKTPAEVRVTRVALPRTASGKLRRGSVREMLAAGAAQDA